MRSYDFRPDFRKGNREMTSYPDIDTTKYQKIPVIASFSSDGDILPLYMKVNGEEYKILSSIMERQHAIIVFEIKFETHGRIKETLLYYRVEDHFWYAGIRQ